MVRTDSSPDHSSIFTPSGGAGKWPGWACGLRRRPRGRAQSSSACVPLLPFLPPHLPLPPTETFHLHFPVAISKTCCSRGILIIIKVKVLLALQCLTLCNPADCSPSGSSVHGTSQARTLEWVAIPLSGESSWPRDGTWVSRTAGGFFTICINRKAQW